MISTIDILECRVRKAEQRLIEAQRMMDIALGALESEVDKASKELKEYIEVDRASKELKNYISEGVYHG